MRRHISYLKYVLWHKWFVLVAAWRIGAPLGAALLHDMSKFLPSEWLPYANTFYAEDGSSRYEESPAFQGAWNSHQKRNKHHWQRWVLIQERGEDKPLPMPRVYILEMVADWMGAGRTITGKWEVRSWYLKNKHNIRLHPATRGAVERVLEQV